LVGGVLGNFGTSARLGEGEDFVVEGDEYDTAYFDKGPKFLHYRPRTLIFTSCEFDHADIYRDTAHYESAFERLMEILPEDGVVFACASTEAPPRIARRARCRVESYSAVPGVEADWTAEILSADEAGTRFRIRRKGEPLLEASLPMGGRHNVENALAAFAACLARGADPEKLREGLAGFRGVRRRQEVRGEVRGIRVIDDFAHHPTAVVETIAAVRATHPGRRLIAAFEPRSNTSRRSIHQGAYASSFDRADRVLVQSPLPHDRVPENERLDAEALCARIRERGIFATAHGSADEILETLVGECRPGDVVLVMSNGSFGGLVDRLLRAL
jgi:UDP-N-acetylmuramate: L-alanyl-gamma-D-glutamyl-meso-diaminopimelate ligase